jgi:ubiquinol-cytochrome c reductase cytochrome b subunit
MGGLLSINPVWRFGPYNPSEVTAGSQPDWYMGVAEGLLRIMPGWETHLWGFTISWNVFLPGVVAPGLIFTAVMAYPFIEAWITGDKREHHLLQRPRNAPNRTAFLVAAMTLFGLLWMAGGNDIIGNLFHISINNITYFMRAAIFVGPPIAFMITRRWCIALQRQDDAKVLHGYETGIIMRSPEGGYSERHEPIPLAQAYSITARDREEVLPLPAATDYNGVKSRQYRLAKLRARLSKSWFGYNVQKPTREELEAAHHHAEEELARSVHGHQNLPAGDYSGAHELDGHPVDGHQFDGRHPVDGDELRKQH